MKKFVFIGAGSMVFTRNLVRDILTYPAFADATISLVDVSEERLEVVGRVVRRIVEKGNYPARVETTTDRRKALEGADGIVCTIQVGGVQVFRRDIEIPMQFGVDLCIGDTRGPGGIFRYLRTIPIMLDILKDVEEICPNAYFLNYTNPMAMLCRAMQEKSKVAVTGLCHSVQGTSAMLAKWIGAPMDEITYTCCGVNHQAFYLDFKWNGKDAYPLIREAITTRPEIYNEEQVRNEMFLHLGYYVTESSGHNSEYNPWFRKRKDLLEKYCTHGTGWNPGLHGDLVRRRLEDNGMAWKTEIEKWLQDDNIDLKRGNEYAAGIFNALFGDGEFYRFNGNVRNFGLVDNLIPGCCVEVPVLASKNGFQPTHVGKMPDHLAVLNNLTAGVEELAMMAGLDGDKEKVYEACYMDPLTSAVCSLAEIREMVDLMFEENEPYLPQFKF